MFTSLINKCYLWICIVLNFVVTGSAVLEIFLRKEKFLTRGPKVLNSKLNVRQCTLTCQKNPYLQVNKPPQRRGKKDVVVKRICLRPWSMANSKDSHSHKDKYVDTSRKILEYSSEVSKL